MHTRAAFVVAVVLSGCNVGFEAPADARINCASDAQCPSGWFCKPALGRCSQTHDEGSPPTLAHPATVTPGFAARGTLVTVEFESTQPLGVPPVVELATSPRTAFVPYSQTGLVYTYALVVGPAVPEGTHSVLGRLVSESGAVSQDLALGTVQVDATPPTITRIDVLTPAVRSGASARVEATFGEPLTVSPGARILGGPALVTEATGDAAVWRFRLDVTGTETEGPVSVEVNAQDAAGNAATRTATDAFVLDFTDPALGAGSPVIDTPNVRAGQQIAVHAGFTEPLAVAPAVRLLGRSTAAIIPLAMAEQVGTAYTFGATVQPTAAEEVYDVQVRSFTDVAGNPGTDVTAGGTVTVDRTAPSLTAGPTATKTGARYKRGDQPRFTFTASEALAGKPAAHLTTTPPLALGCDSAGGLAWSCELASALTGDERPESAVKAVFDLTDPAGNARTFSADAILDFHDPAIDGSVALDLTPPAGSLVSPVTAVRAGTRIRVSFTASEPLAVDPVVVTSTPEALSFAKVSQSGTFYVYEHVLSAAAHAQGTYAVKATLTDLAGNSAAPLLALPAPGIRVDTGMPMVPDVVTTTAITYARVPWGTAATGGVPQFTVTGLAGSVEANATVIAYDGEFVASSREIGRTTATAAGAFGPMTLIAADRREVYVVAVDAAGNASDAKGATGIQGVRVRSVTWTATLLNKVLGSTVENPHQLEARARWLGVLEQGASVEALLATSTVGSLGWRLGSSPGWISGTPVATDTRRGRLVVPTPTAVWEWDGEVWSSVAATGGPSAVTAAVYDARRAEVLVYEGACDGGTTLWAWTGTVWQPRAQGASYTQWGAYGAPAPGPHRKAFLTYDEARGEVVLAPGSQFLMGPYVCGDVSGALDYGTYAWNGTSWRLLPGASTYATADGRWLAYDASRRVVARQNSGGIAEWDGSVWTTIDPAGITTGPSAGSTGEAVYDPGMGRIIFQADTDVWSWSGTNWARASGTAYTGSLARGFGDYPSDRPLLVGSTYLYRWYGSGATGSWSAVGYGSAGPPDPVAVVYSSGRARSEAFDAAGDVYRWSSTYGAWVGIAIGTRPPGVTGAAGLDGTGNTALSYVADRGSWTWDGSSWTSITPATAVRPSVGNGMAYVPGTGPVCRGGNFLYYWSANQWTSSPLNSNFFQGPLAAAPALPGVYLAMQEPYNSDYRIRQWTAADGGTPTYSAAGLGNIYPIAADGSNRTFVLQADGLFQLSGSTLVPVSVDDPRRVGHPASLDASTWDPTLNAVVVLSGTNTWFLETEAKSRPGHVFRVAWPTGGGPGGDCFQRGGTCTVRSVAVSWRGLLSSDGSAGSTATLSLWNENQWVPVASATSTGAAVQASASTTVTDANILGHLAAPPASEIDLAIVLPSTSLPAPLLRTNDVSVTVAYRLP